MKPYNKKQKKATHRTIIKNIKQQSREEIAKFNKRADEIDQTDKNWLALRNTGY